MQEMKMTVRLSFSDPVQASKEFVLQRVLEAMEEQITRKGILPEDEPEAYTERITVKYGSTQLEWNAD